MRLILMRHGPAESITNVSQDAERKLTTTGRDKTLAACSGLVRLLEMDGIAQKPWIWHSRLLRSVETAEILATQAGGALVEKDFIASGSCTGLRQALRQDLSDDPSLLIIVGHQPSLASFSQQLCGLPLPFKKCAAASFNLAPIACQGELLWFLQPATLRGLS